MITKEFTKYDKAQPDNGSGLAEQQLTDLFDIPMEAVPAMSELEVYLIQPIEKVKDPIAWWWDHRAVFPKLSAMALDYLSAPGVCLAGWLFALPFVLMLFPSHIHSCRTSVLTRPAPPLFYTKQAFSIDDSGIIVPWRLVPQ